MPPFADIQSVIDFNDSTNSLHHETKSYPLHFESSTRKVSFSDSVAVRSIKRASSYSKQERKATWYSIKELRKLRNELKYDVYRMTSGQLDPNEESTRGLEGRTEEGFEQKYQARTSSWTAVFQAQDRQYIRGFEDPVFVAAVYHEYTSVSQYIALLRGRQDEKAARE